MSPDTDSTNWPSGWIPERIYGPVQDEVYTLIGKVVAIGAFLEDCLLQLLWALDNKRQDIHAGASASELSTLIEPCLDRISDDSLQDRIKQALEQSKDLMAIRNAVAHSLWPNATLDRMHGWRPKRGKGKTPADWIVWVELSGPQLRDAIERMVVLSSVVERLSQEVHASPEIVKHKVYGASTS